MSAYEEVQKSVAFIKEATTVQPRVGVVLGSGLGAFAEKVQGRGTISYGDIPHFPTSSVEGHAGKLVFGNIEGVPVAVMNGRVHYYEGFTMKEVVFPVRVLAGLGVRKLVVTNAAGGINPDFAPGNLMMITDQINLTGDNPLRGQNDERTGPRFPDMSHAYGRAGQEALTAAAGEIGVPLAQGVYVGLAGPSYETPAEIRMLRTLGADAVGMSTVAEVIAASHAGLEVAGLSVITNHAAGIIDAPLSHDEVKDVGSKVRELLTELLAKTVVKFA